MSKPSNTDGMFTFPTSSKAITQNALESIECAIAFDVRDWSSDRRSAWIYSIVFGWDYGDGNDGDNEWIYKAEREMMQRFEWDKEDIERAKTMHLQWEKAKQWLSQQT